MTAETVDYLPYLPAVQMLTYGVVDIGQQFVIWSGVPGPHRPVAGDRELPAHSQLGQERTAEADVEEGPPHGDTCPLSSTATSSSISAISTALTPPAAR